MNKAILIGNLTREPEHRVTQTGLSVCNFTIACTRRFQNQQGEREADFIPVVTWRGQADTCARYLHKGSKVAVVGMIQTRTYEAQDGSKRYMTEVVADEVEFLSPRSQEGSGQSGAPQGGGGQGSGAASGYADEGLPDFTSIDDDELPF